MFRNILFQAWGYGLLKEVVVIIVILQFFINQVDVLTVKEKEKYLATSLLHYALEYLHVSTW